MSRSIKTKSAVTIGTFDGVHRGHQRILEALNQIAATEGLVRVAYAFVFPPRLALRGEEQGLLLPKEAKTTILKRYVDRVEHASFSDISKIAPDVFVREVLLGRLSAGAVVVGEDFRFGRNRAGDLSLLSTICEEGGASVAAVSPVMIDGAVVSSTRIRKLISQGMVEEASVLLGRPPLLVGGVVHGDHLGKKLGYPTANLSIDSSILLPRDGIYLVHAFWDDDRSPGLLYVGTRPTLDGTDRRCEVHLFAAADGSGQYAPTVRDGLYGKTMEVQIRRRLRDSRRFPTLAQLQEQMEQDVERAREILASSGWPQEPIVT